MKKIKINKPVWVIGDVHGEYDQLIKLLEKIPKTDNICFVGDLIDRGYKSKEVIQLIKEKGYFTVTGNHEVLMIEAIEHDNMGIWIRNGGIETIRSYTEITRSIYQEGFHKNKELKKILKDKDMLDDIKWMKTLPKIIKFELNNEKPLYVSHSGIRIDEDDNLIDSYNPEHQVLWNRFKQLEVDYAVNIHGHTPTKESDISTSQINVDSGGFLDNSYVGLGFLTGVCYPTMEKVYSKDNVNLYDQPKGLV